MNQEAWQNVLKNLNRTRGTHLREFFAADPNRAAKFTVSAAGWTLDYSKNRVDAKLMNALVALAEASDLRAELKTKYASSPWAAK